MSQCPVGSPPGRRKVSSRRTEASRAAGDWLWRPRSGSGLLNAQASQRLQVSREEGLWAMGDPSRALWLNHGGLQGRVLAR